MFMGTVFKGQYHGTIKKIIMADIMRMRKLIMLITSV